MSSSEPTSPHHSSNNSSAVGTHKKTSTELKTFKIIAIGDSGVGKTCLTYRFCSGKFPVKTEVTIGVDFREKCVEIEGETIKLQLWDTAGQERFRKSMIHHYYRNVNAVVFVYDVTSPISFDSLPNWISECEKYNLTSVVPRILVGNKVDCDVQAVPTNVAQKFADMHNMPLFETSALADSSADHVESIFLTLAHKLKASKSMMVGGGGGEQGGPSGDSAANLVQLHNPNSGNLVGQDSADSNSSSSTCLC